MLVPYKMLSPETLQGLIEDFVTRDGTDNGDETSLEVRSERVKKALDNHTAFIAFDEVTESCYLVLKQDIPPEWLKDLV